MSVPMTANVAHSSRAQAILARMCARPEPPARLVCHSRDSASRSSVEDFVQHEFRVHFNANVKHFMPVLLALHGRDGAPRAVLGCRAAAMERLFLEAYTQEPVERTLARHCGTEVSRASIVEIGSLACRGGRAAVEIVKAVIPLLLGVGFKWVVFTGADTVMNVFAHLRLAPLVLCSANQTLLGAGRHEWGTYYDHNPRVMAGRLRDGLDALHGLSGLA